MLQQYIEAFNRCYPHKTVDVVPVRSKKHGEPPKYAAIINNNRGDILLSEDDIRSATRMFNRGKSLK